MQIWKKWSFKRLCWHTKKYALNIYIWVDIISLGDIHKMCNFLSVFVVSCHQNWQSKNSKKNTQLISGPVDKLSQFNCYGQWCLLLRFYKPDNKTASDQYYLIIDINVTIYHSGSNTCIKGKTKIKSWQCFDSHWSNYQPGILSGVLNGPFWRQLATKTDTVYEYFPSW